MSVTASELGSRNLKPRPPQYGAVSGSPRCRAPAAAGFTLVELIVVITILGVIAALAAPRFTDNTAFAERGYFEELSNSLRLAHKVAIGSGCPVRVTITAGGYQGRQQNTVGNRCDLADSTWPQVVLLPDGRTLDGTAPAGVTATPPVTIVFDGLGSTDLGANQTLSVGGFSLVVHADSGFVDTP